MPESDALIAARNAVHQAIAAYAQIENDERVARPEMTAFDATDGGDVFVTAWAVSVEYLVPSWVQQEITGSMNIIKDDQSPAHTRGLFELGADTFTRRMH